MVGSQLTSGGHYGSDSDSVYSAVHGMLFIISGAGAWVGPANRTSGKLFNAFEINKKRF